MENRKIRVLHVAQAAGGVDRYLKTLFKYMDKDEVENILVASHDYVKSDYQGLVSDFQYLNMKRAIPTMVEVGKLLILEPKLKLLMIWIKRLMETTNDCVKWHGLGRVKIMSI